VTGSATASNILFSEFQVATAQSLGLPAITMLAAQTFGAAIGNIACPHNIIAGGATVGLQGEEGHALRATLPVCLIYAAAGGLLVLAVVAAITVVSAIIFNAVTIAMPKVLEERLVGITITATGIGFAASAVYAIAAFTQIAVGRALDRYAVRGLLTFLALGQVVAFAAAAFAMNWSLLAAVLVLMIMVFGQVPVGSILIARYTPDVIRARVYGFQYLLVFGVGALAVPLIAIQYQWGGFAGLFLIMAAMAVVIVLIAQMLPETRPAESVSTGRA
jgi:MFS family permease